MVGSSEKCYCISRWMIHTAWQPASNVSCSAAAVLVRSVSIEAISFSIGLYGDIAVHTKWTHIQLTTILSSALMLCLAFALLAACNEFAYAEHMEAPTQQIQRYAVRRSSCMRIPSPSNKRKCKTWLYDSSSVMQALHCVSSTVCCVFCVRTCMRCCCCSSVQAAHENTFLLTTSYIHC